MLSPPRVLGSLGGALLMGAVEACWLTASLDGSDGGSQAVEKDASTRDATDAHATDGGVDARGADARRTDAGAADATRTSDGGDARTLGDAGKDAAGSSDAGSPYRALVLEAGPTVYYRLGESSGTTAANEVVSNGTATYEQIVALRQDGAIFNDPSTAVHFGGDAGCLDMSNVSALSFSGTQSLTIELWIKPTLFDSNYRNIFFENEQGNGTDGSYALFVYQPPGAETKPTMSFERRAPGVANTVTVDAPQLGTFTYVAAVYDGQKLYVYVNGNAPMTTASGTAITGTVSGNARAGCGTSGPGFEGTLDEIAVYKKALSPAEISAHYTLGQRGTLDGG